MGGTLSIANVDMAAPAYLFYQLLKKLSASPQFARKDRLASLKTCAL